MAFFRKLLMLVWKNLIFRKRHYILTGLEIILPTVLIIVVAYVKSKVPSDEDGSGGYKSEATVFEVNTQERILERLSWRVSRNISFVAYSPINDQVEEIISQLENATSDIGLRWDGYTTEKEIEALISQDQSFNWTSPKNQMVAAVIFEQGFTGDGSGKEFGYKIRTVDRHTETNLLFPAFEYPGFDWYNLESYLYSGFLAIQILIDTAIIQIQGQTKLNDEWVNLQPFPYPAFSYGSEFDDIFNVMLPIVLCAGFVFIVTTNVKGIVGEKETGIKELLKMLGLPSWLQLFAWMINSILGLALTMTIIVILLFIPFNTAVGAVIQYSDPTVWWLVLMIFAFSSTAMCFFISSFFQKSTLATTVGILFWLIAYFAIVLPLNDKYGSMSLAEKMAFCLLPHAGLTYAIKVMAGFEGKAVGAQWKNMFEPISTVDSLSVGLILVSMLTSTLLYLLLTLYVENIMPTEFGVRKPWYYIFQLSTWKTSKVSTETGSSLQHSASHGKTFEADPVGIEAGIDVQGLCKKFGSRTVVNQVSFKMFEGQITALLGHNGAGKTTTISMLTGLIAPSGGTAKINGYDINTDMEAIHANLGLCPQHNMLFEDLTVVEHLMFFARLKGISLNGAKEEVKELLEKLQLTEKKNVLSKSLSGGQKRKLSLGIALVGESKVVILDEPTSGMDPEARRGFWDLLLVMRGHRTLLLTTHFMEEADVLGDRIAIMADGQIQCCGTPLFLKRCYGAGFTLSLTMADNRSANSILSTVQKYFGSAYFKSHESPSASEIAITIPSESNDTSGFPGMFSELYKRKDELGIETIGMSLTTMDDVFIKVGEKMEKDESLHDEPYGGNDDNSRRRVDSEENLISDPPARVQGFRLGLQQFYALLAKRVLYTIRKKRLFLTQLLLPVLLVILALIVTNKFYESRKDPPPLTMSINSYKNAITLYSFNGEAEDTGKVYAQVVGSSAREATLSKTLVEALLDVGNRDLAAYRAKYIVAAEMNDTTINAMYSSIPYHAAPLCLNLASNTMLKKQLASNEYSIKVTNHPINSNSDIYSAIVDPLYQLTNPLIFAIMLPIGLALAAASFVVFPVEERLCKAKQLQLMTGVNPLIYWTSSLCWDMLLILLLIIAILACFPIFESNYVLTTTEGLTVLFAILIAFGFSAISFSHLSSFFAGSVVRGFTWITIIHIVTGVVMCIVVFVLDNASDYSKEALNGARAIRTLARVFPTFGAALSTMKFVKTATQNSKCDLLKPEILSLLCNPDTPVGDEARACCADCALLFPEAPCFKPEPFWEWTTTEEKETGPLKTAGIGQEIFFMVLMGIVFQIIIFLIETGLLKKALGLVYKNKESIVKNVEGDDDVKRENAEIDSLIAGGKVSEEAMVVTNLSKSFGDLAAVSNLNFRVHHGECFGLLGVNGAGKTTSFRMLTGDEVPSSGDAFAAMCSLSGNRKRFLASIGYCPQFDGIIGVLSGLEMVKLFCRLRGIRSDYVEEESKKWMDRLGLTGSNDVQCSKYSGGMKRRLSTAMALVGDPPIIMFDEPTSGVDPIARRQFWKIIGTIRASGQAVILTSHSMEECEALCGRLGIMVNGQMQCLGGVEHLKHKYAQGFSVMVKLASGIDAESEPAQQLQKLVLQKFKNSILKDKHQNVLQFQIMDSSIPWHILFQIMEDIKLVHGTTMEDYCINATTLEEVFLSFARKSYNARVSDQPWYRRMLCMS